MRATKTVEPGSLHARRQSSFRSKIKKFQVKRVSVENENNVNETQTHTHTYKGKKYALKWNNLRIDFDFYQVTRLMKWNIS